MFMLRNRLKGARFAPFSFVVCLLTVAPTEIGYQDIASRLAHQAGVTERWQQHLFASARSSLRVASFNFVRPVGTDVQQPVSVLLASFNDHNLDVTGAIDRNPLGQAVRPLTASDYPTVVRTLKGDRLPVIAPAQDIVAQPATEQKPSNENNASVRGAKTAEQVSAPAEPLDEELQAALNAPRLQQYDVTQAPDGNALDDKALAALKVASDAAAKATSPSQDPFSVKTSSLFFGNASLGDTGEALERWQPGEEPVVVIPGVDPDLKLLASLPNSGTDQSGGETVAGKGVVNAENQQVKTPAQRLGLEDKALAKGEKCLAEAVYFEARGEAVRGQIAVAQVVMNRVFSGFYPNTICGVVYQNSHRHLACQFTFACDNVRDVIEEPEMWERAKKIAKAELNGQLWLPEVGKSTHYHAYWVRPSWVNEMKKMYRFGVHTFYRPRAWGDGHEAPSWGTAAQTAQISEQLAEAAKSSAEMETSKR